LLLSKVTEHTSKLKDNKALITSASESLSAYYQESGKTEQQLLSLIAQEQQVAVARRFVSDTDSKLKSRHDAIADAQKQIDLAMKTLDISNRSQLPDRQQLEEEKVSTSSQRDEILSKMAQARNRLDTHLANIQRLKEIEAQLEEAKKRFARWDRLNRIFGGTKFRTLVQTYILRPLLNNANIYLEQITDRYRLTCSEDNEQLSILVVSAS
jgi:DNA repair exonuclease SbcCD ATPase subunit